MLLNNMRRILAKMRQDPTIAPELPIVGRSIKRTFSWMLFTELFLVLQVFPVKFFMDEIIRPDGTSSTRIGLIALAFAVLYKLGQEFMRRMDTHRNDVFWGCWRIWWGYGNRCLLRQSSDWHTRHSTGEKESLVGKNVNRFQNLFDEALFNTLPVTLRIGFTTGLMFFIGWPYGLVAVATCLVYGLVIWRTEIRIAPLREEFQARMREVDDKGSEINQNWRTIRTLGMEEIFADQNEHLLRSFWIDETPRHRTYLRYVKRQDSVVVISRALLYFVAGLLVIRSGGVATSLGSIVLATTWMERAYSNFGRFNDFQRQLNTGKQALHELVQFMGTEPTVQNTEWPKWPDSVDGTVCFDDVTFAYQNNGDEPTICTLNLQVPEYTSMAFVGESGSGKSTLMRLLSREYDPLHGSITVDGVDLREMDYVRYRHELIAVVSQTIELFNRSIKDNIRIARPNASDEDVVTAAKSAGAHEFICATDHGYDTLVGEDGLRLSGGQRQRLAIARALLMRPAILILDEATSSLDAMSQAEVQATIDELIARHTCTVFIIAHRLSTIRGADCIVVMDKGKIEALGSHAELLETSDIYRKMNSLEAG